MVILRDGAGFPVSYFMFVYLRLIEPHLGQIDEDSGRRYVNRIWERFGITCKAATFRSICASSMWSGIKFCRFRNINKYTADNAEYYLIYRAMILTFDWYDILFYDESSFNERGILLNSFVAPHLTSVF